MRENGLVDCLYTGEFITTLSYIRKIRICRFQACKKCGENNKIKSKGAYRSSMLSSGKYQYKTTCEHYTDCQAGEHEGYAIIGRERFGQKAYVLKDVTVSRDCAVLMAQIMNNHQVDLCQMRDVTEDLLATLKS